jgi:tRNA (uracil-5-)-methyltransferase TRM9
MSVPSIAIEKGLNPKDQEQDYVHNIYNEIASHFSQTRYKPWPIVEKFLLDQDKYSIGIDVGCGNGKYLVVNKDIFIIGSDRSSGLIECAQQNSNNDFNLAVADGMNLPHGDNTFDFAISIAVIHHFSTPERRVGAIAHILSKLKSGGKFLVYCWALEQENSRRGYKEGDEQDILIPWVLPQKKEKKDKKQKKPRTRSKMAPGGDSEINEVQSDPIQDITKSETPESETPVESSSLVSKSQNKPETKYRYYHLYKKGELASDCLQTGLCTIVDQGYEKDNWWVIAQKN